MSFHVGQKVICVDDAVCVDNAGPKFRGITKGAIYTIHSINDDGICWLRLIESAPESGGYSARRFRPIVERKTDISIFTTLLDGVKQGERV